MVALMHADFLILSFPSVCHFPFFESWSGHFFNLPLGQTANNQKTYLAYFVKRNNTCKKKSTITEKEKFYKTEKKMADEI